MKRITIFLLIFLMTMTVFAQKQEFISIGFNNEKLSNTNIRTGLSFSYENQLSKHHGFVVGVNQRFSEKFFSNIQFENLFVSFHVSEKYLSVPFLYKFSSSIVNVSAGFNCDYFVGWKELSDNSRYILSDYSFNPKLSMGFLLKLGKTIQLTPKFYLEPEIMYNPMFSYEDSFTGVNLHLKYKL